jgi:hypothetical protein
MDLQHPSSLSSFSTCVLVKVYEFAYLATLSPVLLYAPIIGVAENLCLRWVEKALRVHFHNVGDLLYFDF